MGRPHNMIDTGEVILAGNPAEDHSVSWVEFDSFPVFGEVKPSEVNRYAVPVSTRDLVDAGINPVAGEFFEAIINIAAEHKSEVMPKAFRSAPALVDQN